VVVPVAPVVVVDGMVVVVLATVVVADDVVDVDVESTVVVVIVTTGSATSGEHAGATASTNISQTWGLPDPMRAMCALRTTRAFWSASDSSVVDENVVCGQHMVDGMQAEGEEVPIRGSGESAGQTEWAGLLRSEPELDGCTAHASSDAQTAFIPKSVMDPTVESRDCRLFSCFME